MALNPSVLAAQPRAMDTEGKSQGTLTLEFANIITNYIKSAQVVGQGAAHKVRSAALTWM